MRPLRIVITVTALVIAVLHVAVPMLKIDAVALALIVVAALPWLAPLVRSLELPGGFKVELRDVKAASDKVTEWRVGHEGLGPTGAYDRPGAVERLVSVSASDPNLALVGAGIEIEKRLRELAEQSGVEAGSRSANYLLNRLMRAQVIPPDVVSGLRELITLRNLAAHGSTVTEEAARWALEVLPAILETLDLIARRQGEASR
jgi:hypothetical protein